MARRHLYSCVSIVGPLLNDPSLCGIIEDIDSAPSSLQLCIYCGSSIKRRVPRRR